MRHVAPCVEGLREGGDEKRIVPPSERGEIIPQPELEGLCRNRRHPSRHLAPAWVVFEDRSGDVRYGADAHRQNEEVEIATDLQLNLSDPVPAPVRLEVDAGC